MLCQLRVVNVFDIDELEIISQLENVLHLIEEGSEMTLPLLSYILDVDVRDIETFRAFSLDQMERASNEDIERFDAQPSVVLLRVKKSLERRKIVRDHVQLLVSETLVQRGSRCSIFLRRCNLPCAIPFPTEVFDTNDLLQRSMTREELTLNQYPVPRSQA
jgi:hypothetical protein